MTVRPSVRRAAFVAAGVLSAVSFTACTHPQNVYDNVYSDNHRWTPAEERAYRRWEAEQSIQHATYTRRNADEQRAYWTWRHAHPDADR